MADAKRIFLIVLDSLGIGAMSDAGEFGDADTVNTLRHIAEEAGFSAETMRQLGLGRIDGVSYIGTPTKPGKRAAVARMRERSRGKDTTIGHWEIAGIVSETALPTFPNGFPDEVLEAISAATGRGILCNEPYSGTKVI
ncbi:MAG: phosphopentomutase, partial [Clostridia bacterium]|nr:phosphopentomutase [Clostridia bacterium]